MDKTKRKVKVRYIIIIIVAILLAAACAALVWQWDNIKALKYSQSMSEEEIQSELDENQKEFDQVAEEFNIADMNLTQEQIDAVVSGALTVEFKLLTYEYNVGGKSHTLTVMDVTEARNNLDAIKTKFDTVMRTRYHSLLQIEDQIDSLMLQYEILCENIDTARIYYDTGAAAKSQLEELLQTQADLKMNIDSLKVTHSMNRVLLEKPYLAPEYVTA